MRQLGMIMAMLLAAGPVIAQDNVAASDVPPLAAVTAADGANLDEAEAASADIAEAVEEETMAPYGPVPVTDEKIGDFKWQSRLVVVFADSPRDPAFIRQIDLLMARPDELIARDVVILTDSDPGQESEIRTELRPRGFAMVVVDKDSRVMFRKPSPWDVRELTRAIDKTPLREQELREEQATRN